MSGLWNFTLSTDNASGTHKDSAKIQGVEGQCLQGIKVTFVRQTPLLKESKCLQEALAEITLYNIAALQNGRPAVIREGGEVQRLNHVHMVCVYLHAQALAQATDFGMPNWHPLVMLSQAFGGTRCWGTTINLFNKDLLSTVWQVLGNLESMK